MNEHLAPSAATLQLAMNQNSIDMTEFFLSISYDHCSAHLFPHERAGLVVMLPPLDSRAGAWQGAVAAVPAGGRGLGVGVASCHVPVDGGGPDNNRL